MTLSIQDVLAARERIAPYIVRTPLLRVLALDEVLGCEVYLKPENLQHTGSFKLRGATSRLTLLTEEEKARGIVTASSGNHAKSLACAARRIGVDATVIMPEGANPAKLAGVRSYGATVMFEGTLSSERTAKARELVVREGRTLVHSHADFYVLAGQGTIGLEILQDQPDLDAVVLPLGGGGLSSGVATAVKATRPATRVISVEPEAAPRYAASRAAHCPLSIETGFTIADGTRCNKADAGNFEIIERLVDEIVSVDDAAIREAVRLSVLTAKMVAEPSSVMGLAAAMTRKLSFGPKDKVCFVITGGNNDMTLLTEILSTSHATA